MYLRTIINHKPIIMKKTLLLFGIALTILSCAQPKQDSSATVSNQDDKTMAVAKLMKGYVENNFDGSILSEGCIVRFNNIELTKEDFIGMSQFHHSMFDDITFPDGWIETISYHGENWKEGNGETWTNQWTKWTATSKISKETHTNRSHFSYKWENEKIVEVNALFSDLWYDKEVKLFMENQK